MEGSGRELIDMSIILHTVQSCVFRASIILQTVQSCVFRDSIILQTVQACVFRDSILQLVVGCSTKHVSKVPLLIVPSKFSELLELCPKTIQQVVFRIFNVDINCTTL